MKVVDIANEIYIESGSPTSTSIAAIAFWIRSKVGSINILLFEDFAVNDASYEILDGDGAEITPEAVAVIKQMYRIYDYELQIRTNLNAISTDSILRVDDQGSSVTKINKNEVSKTIASLRKDDLTTLDKLVTAYRNRLSTPSQVAGDDTEVGRYDPERVYDLRLGVA